MCPHPPLASSANKTLISTELCLSSRKAAHCVVIIFHHDLWFSDDQISSQSLSRGTFVFSVSFLRTYGLSGCQGFFFFFFAEKNKYENGERKKKISASAHCWWHLDGLEMIHLVCFACLRPSFQSSAPYNIFSGFFFK